MGYSVLLHLKRLCAPLAALMVLSACSVSVDEGRPIRPPVRPNSPQMCTMEYAPVCGVRNGKTRTLANSCQARAEGYRIIGNGECRPSQSRPPQWQQRPDRPGGAMRPERPGRPSGSWGGNNGGNWGGNNRPQTACTREYAPVCATNRGRSQTFPNACVARNAGFENMRNGACR
ncbi:Kazal-type serine protease inhibitor [Pseudochrobactrum sp. sp1633]|uniref:Kazal-type serine protease inhibitor family protein n=1 Tax=Pseudochrobactrum sp. sp1633 TaxID=3036706 RepID=UPI0025A61C54|nr:Kazal-type serine protease inhibitor [Pseudochrobactrum sp. sp1633]MDM8346616.1 Kazal-type serine protease inhibitor [Pseudochrobactrum sp. sp1633]HWD14008.1 Kazal-type serine protease inhibitor [Pseudochrobactrum sp.]